MGWKLLQRIHSEISRRSIPFEGPYGQLGRDE